MKKMTKKTLASYRKMMDDLYDFMCEVIGNKTDFSVDINRWNASHGEYLAFSISIEDPETHNYSTDKSYKSFMTMSYSNCGTPIEEAIEQARQFVIKNYKD